jgi:hypothetical protein
LGASSAGTKSTSADVFIDINAFICHLDATGAGKNAAAVRIVRDGLACDCVRISVKVVKG